MVRLISLLCTLVPVLMAASPPNIIHMVVDDWGHADVGYNNAQIKSPYIDSLAADGVKLSSHYVYRFCSPSRSSFMTGRYPWHVGQATTQNLNPTPAIACGINLNYSMTPAVLKKANYNSMATGKWHLGFLTNDYTPTFRGYDEYLGYYSGAEEHFTHEKQGIHYTAFDLSNNSGPLIQTCPALVGQNGTYSSYVYGNYTNAFLDKQNKDTPFFVYLAWNNVHAPCEAPQQFVDLNNDIQNTDRRNFAGMMSALDVAFKQVVDKLKERDLYDNTIIVVTTDNGGNLGGSGNNYPLRGGKYTFWEGGVRGNAFIHSALLPAERRGTTWDGIMHAVDWYATFAGMAGVSIDDSGPIPADGVNVWPAILNNLSSPRDHVTLQINSHKPDGSPTNFTGIVRKGSYKLIVGYPGWGNAAWDGWVPIPQVDADGKTEDDAYTHVAPSQYEDGMTYPCSETPCLYNVEEDATEHHDIATQFPDIVQQLSAIITEEAKTEVNIQQAGLCPTSTGINADPKCNAKAKETGFWEPWLNN